MAALTLVKKIWAYPLLDAVSMAMGGRGRGWLNERAITHWKPTSAKCCHPIFNLI